MARCAPHCGAACRREARSEDARRRMAGRARRRSRPRGERLPGLRGVDPAVSGPRGGWWRDTVFAALQEVADPSGDDGLAGGAEGATSGRRSGPASVPSQHRDRHATGRGTISGDRMDRPEDRDRRSGVDDHRPLPPLRLHHHRAGRARQRPEHIAHAGEEERAQSRRLLPGDEAGRSQGRRRDEVHRTERFACLVLRRASGKRSARVGGSPLAPRARLVATVW